MNCHVSANTYIDNDSHIYISSTVLSTKMLSTITPSLNYPFGWSTKSLTQCETDLGLNVITVPNSFIVLSKPFNHSKPQFTQLQNENKNSISLGCCEALMRQSILGDRFSL